MQRSKMKRSKSKRDFRNKSGAHPKNSRSRPLRGGWRL